jgi:protein SCO1/2
VVVLTFLYSTCRDLCPAQAADIIEAIGRLGPPAAAQVIVYGVSVDPVGDTPQRARAFL